MARSLKEAEGELEAGGGSLYEVIEGDLRKVITKVPKGIAGKLVKILEAAGSVPKKGTNRAQNYKFVRETDLVDMIRPIMAAEKLFLNLDIIDHEIAAEWKTSSSSTMRLTVIKVRGTWVDAETGDIWPIPSTFIGYGADTGDKGVYKAITGAEKYFLFKSFLVGTGDDPEGDERTDRNAAAGGGPVRVRRGQPDGAPRGGRQGKASGPQLNAVTRLVREAGLEAEGLRNLIAKETGTKLEEDVKISDWIAQQPGGMVGKIIGALTELVSETAGPVDRDKSHSLDEDEGTEDGSGTTPDTDDDLPL